MTVLDTMMYRDDGWGWGAWLMMTIFMVVSWGLVAWVAKPTGTGARHVARP
jgi:hypothetical protein